MKYHYRQSIITLIYGIISIFSFFFCFFCTLVFMEIRNDGFFSFLVLFLFKAFYIQGLLFFLLVIALSLLLAGRGKGWGGVALYLLGCWTECGFGASATSLSYSQRELAVYLPLKYIECMENSHRRDYSTHRQTGTRVTHLSMMTQIWHLM